MKSFSKSLLIYFIAFIIITWWSNSPLGIDQLYDSILSNILEDKYINYFYAITGIIVLILLIKYIYKSFKNRPKKFFIRYFRLYGFLFCLNSIFTFIFYSYIFSYTLFYSFLYINRLETTLVNSHPYQKHKNNIEDKIFSEFKNQNYIDNNKTYNITTKYGLLNLPYSYKIETK